MRQHANVYNVGTAWRSSFAIQSSIAGGAVYNDPLNRDPDDQVGFAMAWNATNMALYSGTFVRPSETMMELYRGLPD